MSVKIKVMSLKVGKKFLWILHYNVHSFVNNTVHYQYSISLYFMESHSNNLIRR